jgi:hypothetical protein
MWGDSASAFDIGFESAHWVLGGRAALTSKAHADWTSF